MDSTVLRPWIITKCCLLLLLFLTPLLPVRCSPQYSKFHTVTIQGRVLSYSKDPIQGALIVVFTPTNSGEYSCVEVKSNEYGFFKVKVKARDFVGLIIVKDCKETLGLDYLPKMILLSITSNYEVKLEETLIPGATVVIKLPASVRGFKVKCYVWVNIKEKVVKYDFSEYLHLLDIVRGDSTLLNKLKDVLKISETGDIALAVPANVKFELLVNLLMEKTLERALFKFDNSSSYYKLPKGGLLKLDLRKELIARVGLSELHHEYEQVRLKLAHLESLGLSLIAEHRRVSKALTLLKEIEIDLKSGKYASAEVKSALASKLIKGIKKSLDSYVSEVESYVKLVMILALFISIALSLVIAKSLRGVIFLSALLYALQLLAVKLSPPSHLIEDWHVILSSFAYYSVFITIVCAVKVIQRRARKVAVVTNFIVDSVNLAVSNIKRRKTLNALLITSIFLVMVSYLSIVSIEQTSELKSDIRNIRLDLNAILVKRINRSAPLPNYVSLNSPLILSIKEQVNAIEVFFKFESLPPAWDDYMKMKCLSEIPESLGYIMKGNKKVSIMGVLGIRPSIELKLVNLSSTLLAGDFINDDDSECVLVSVDLAEELNVSIGDSVIIRVGKVSRKFIIKGIINGSKLAELKDVNGEPYAPFGLEFSTVTSEGGKLLYCPIRAITLNKRLIIVTSDVAPNFGCVVSRALFILPDNDNPVKLARSLAEDFELDVWAFQKGEVQHFYVITLTKVVGGFEITILLTIVASLTASLIMNMVYERREEFSIMSTLGFNPTHLQVVLIIELLLLIITPSFLSVLLSFLGIPKILTAIGITRATLKINVEHTLMALFLITLISIASSQPIIAKSIKALSPNIPIRWILERKSYNEVSIPVKVRKELADNFLTFVEKTLRESVRLTDKSSEFLVYVHKSSKEERIIADLHVLTLNFVISFHASWRYFKTWCKLELKRRVNEEYYNITLYLEPIELHGFHKEHVSYYVGDLMRKIALKWSVEE